VHAVASSTLTSKSLSLVWQSNELEPKIDSSSGWASLTNARDRNDPATHMHEASRVRWITQLKRVRCTYAAR